MRAMRTLNLHETSGGAGGYPLSGSDVRRPPDPLVRFADAVFEAAGWIEGEGRWVPPSPKVGLGVTPRMIPAKRGYPPRVSYTAVAHRYAYSLRSLRAVGAEFGITGERVRQIVEASGLDAKRQRARTRQLLAQKRLAEKARRAPECEVCGRPAVRHADSKWVAKGNAVTCSPECSDRWVRGRYQISERGRDAHRLAIARMYLRNPDKYAKHVPGATRLIAHYEATGEVLPRNRVFSEKGRQAMSDAAKKRWAS